MTSGAEAGPQVGALPPRYENIGVRNGGFGSLARLRDLIAVLLERDLKLRYKRSVLGFVWSLVTPLAQLAVFHFIFTRVVPLGIDDYAVFVFAGLLSWTWFQTALEQSTLAIVDSRELVRRPGFPTPILPVVTVGANLAPTLLALPVFAVFVFFSDARPGVDLLFLPLLIGLQFLLTLGLAYFAAAVHVTFRDARHLLGVLLMLGFYLTPIFYPADAVPERFLSLYETNPMVHIVGAYRWVLLGMEPSSTGALAAIAAASAGLLLVGYRLFRRMSYRFAEEL